MEPDLGLHCLLTLKTNDTIKLTNAARFLDFSKKLIDDFHLAEVGKVHHTFDTHGFTAAICLKESHICTHTWPEHKLLTLDIYLCNYTRNNEPTVKALAKAYIQYFNAEIVSHNEIHR